MTEQKVIDIEGYYFNSDRIEVIKYEDNSALIWLSGAINPFRIPCSAETFGDFKFRLIVKAWGASD